MLLASIAAATTHIGLIGTASTSYNEPYNIARKFGSPTGGPGYGRVSAEGKKVGDGKLDVSGMMTWVDPRAEWLQMFNEAWRLERDFYYDPAMGGLDWKAVGERYRQLVPYVAHRADLNYIIHDMISDITVGHLRGGGGNIPSAKTVPGGLLGADYEIANGRYRFTTPKGDNRTFRVRATE